MEAKKARRHKDFLHSKRIPKKKTEREWTKVKEGKKKESAIACGFEEFTAMNASHKRLPAGPIPDHAFFP